MSLTAFAHSELDFGPTGLRLDHQQVDRLFEQQAEHPGIDLLVLCHGWNNDRQSARSLYDRFANQLLEVTRHNDRPTAAETLSLLAVYWPSKQFDFERSSAASAPDTAGLGRQADPQASVNAALAELRETLAAPELQNNIDQALALVPKLDDLRSAQDAFVALLLPLVRQEVLEPETEQRSGDAPPPSLQQLTGREVLDRLARPLPRALQPRARDTGGAAGNLGRGVQRGAFSLVNLLTFWTMKKRAATVGAQGLQPLLQELLRQTPKLRLHLLGHSFGARLISAAALANAQAATAPRGQIASMTLLQGAFSHHGFAEKFDGENDGVFREVITKQPVKGPMLITHTRNDRAVGLAYPLASRLSRSDASALGDAKDRFGGIGCNGAVHTPEAQSIVLGAHPTRYEFADGGVYNLLADDYVSNHSDVAGAEVASAVLAAIDSQR